MDEQVKEIAQDILDRYPNGWTSIRDMEQFCCEMNGWCPEPELINSDSDSEDDPNLNEQQRQDLSKVTVETLYERTKNALGGTNDNLLVSFLCFSKVNNEKTIIFNNLLEQYLEEHHVKGPDKNKFLRDTLWAMQLKGMQQSTAGSIHQDVSYNLIYMCISLSAEDENFIYNINFII